MKILLSRSDHELLGCCRLFALQDKSVQEISHMLRLPVDVVREYLNSGHGVFLVGAFRGSKARGEELVAAAVAGAGAGRREVGR